MRVFFVRPDASAVGKSIIYFLGMIVWLIVTVLLVVKGNPESYPGLRSLLFVKMGLVGAVFLGRELFFCHYRRPRCSIFIWVVGWLLPLGVQIFRSGTENIILSALDIMIWSIFSAFSLEVLVALFLTWSRVPQMPMTRIWEVWERCWREIIRLGLWVTLTLSLLYFYLIQFYLVDILFYRSLFLILVAGLGLCLFAILTYRINRWITEEIKAIDEQLEPVFQWREVQLNDVPPWFAHYHQWLLIRGYLQSFRWPRISLKKFFYYLFLLVWLYGLPYIFGIML